MRYRFLFDECLTQDLVGVANALGCEAAHVAYRRLLSKPDQRVADYCVDHDLIMVTNNARDFRRIYRRLPLHPGLVIILPSVTIARQRELFAAVFERLDSERDLINKALEIDAEARITIYEWPQVEA